MEKFKYAVQIKQIPGHKIYYKDYFASSIDEFLNLRAENNFLQDLSDKVLRENPQVKLTEPDYNVLVYLDGEFKEKEIHYRFCDAVTEKGRGCHDYSFAEVTPFTAVTVLHKGAYSRLGQAHAFARQWMKENGYEPIGLPRDSAIDGCWNRQWERDYLTEVQIPARRMR